MCHFISTKWFRRNSKHRTPFEMNVKWKNENNFDKREVCFGASEFTKFTCLFYQVIKMSAKKMWRVRTYVRRPTAVIQSHMCWWAHNRRLVLVDAWDFEEEMNDWWGEVERGETESYTLCWLKQHCARACNNFIIFLHKISLCGLIEHTENDNWICWSRRRRRRCLRCCRQTIDVVTVVALRTPEIRMERDEELRTNE